MYQIDRELFYFSTGESGEWTGSGGTAASIASNAQAFFASRDGEPRRIVFYLYSGLVMEREMTGDDGLMEQQYRKFLDQGIYPIYFAWRANFYPMLWQYIKSRVPKELPEDNEARRAINPSLDKFAMTNVKFEWDGLKKRASKVFDATSGGGWSFLQDLLDQLKAVDGNIEYHVVAHGAGALPVITLLNNLSQNKAELNLQTVSLWAPAVASKVFDKEIQSAVEAGRVGKVYLYTLSDQLEQEDTCAIGPKGFFYFSSLLYLVSQGLEVKMGTPIVPIIGMEKYAAESAVLKDLLDQGNAEWIVSNGSPDGATADTSSSSVTHGGFDTDEATVESTIRAIVAK